MVTTAVLTQEDNLSLYLQICAVCRLGFNPTETIEIAEKRVA